MGAAVDGMGVGEGVCAQRVSSENANEPVHRFRRWRRRWRLHHGVVGFFGHNKVAESETSVSHLRAQNAAQNVLVFLGRTAVQAHPIAAVVHVGAFFQHLLKVDVNPHVAAFRCERSVCRNRNKLFIKTYCEQIPAVHFETGWGG